MSTGSWFHLAGTRDVKVYFLMSSLDLGTSSLQGSAAVLVIAPRTVDLTNNFSPPGCNSRWMIL